MKMIMVVRAKNIVLEKVSTLSQHYLTNSLVLPVPETRKGLKRVTLICLLCLMLVIIQFRKYHIWNEKKR